MQRRNVIRRPKVNLDRVQDARVNKAPRDVSDARRFAAMDTEMLTLSLDIHRHGMHLDNAIANHRTEPAGLREHPFRWATPPANPDGTEDLQILLINRLGIDLNARSIDQLNEADAVFRGLLKDLTTIQEWWSKNRTEWGLRREDLKIIERGIQSLEHQLGGRDNIENSPHTATRKQYYLQVAVANSRLEWFSENEKMMRRVMAKVRDIKASVQVQVDRFVNSIPLMEWRFVVENFSLDKEYTLFDFRENTVPWWDEGRGFIRVSADIRDYIYNAMDQDKVVDNIRRKHNELYRAAIADVRPHARNPEVPELLQIELDSDRAALRRLGDPDHPRADAIRARIIALEKRKRQADRIAAENKDHIQVLEKKKERLRVEVLLMEHERPKPPNPKPRERD